MNRRLIQRYRNKKLPAKLTGSFSNTAIDSFTIFKP